MSNYVYEDVIPFNILDAGFYLPVIKQGISTNAINILEGYDPGEDSGLSLVPISGILFTISKQIWNVYKNTISYTDFLVNVKIASNNQTYFSDSKLTSLSCVFGEEYDNINYVTLLGILSGGTRYAPTENVNLEITYTPSNNIFTKNNIPIKTAGRRVIGRHVNWEGSVINFDQYGTRTNLFVPDAKFRDFARKAISFGNRRDTQVHTPIFKFSSYIHLFDPDKDYTQPFINNEFLTDTSLQSKLDLALTENGSFMEDFTAQEGTDAILLNLDAESPAALAVQYLVPTGLIGCSLPNIYELAVIWLESDNIDLIDFTANEHLNTKLGSPNRFGKNTFWSCTEIQKGTSFYGMQFSYSGSTYHLSRENLYSVLPVLEL